MVILIDRREKTPWKFSETTKPATLLSGDYTIEGHESKIIVERKGCVAEFAANLKQKRFEAELVRLEVVPYSFVVCEFTLDELFSFPYGAGLGLSIIRRIKSRGPYLIKRLNELHMTYKTRFIFAGKKGRDFTLSLFKRYLECTK